MAGLKENILLLQRPCYIQTKKKLESPYTNMLVKRNQYKNV